MKFRPCIDIHNGKVKQLVGGSLRDEGDAAKENFVADKDAAHFARLYKNDGLTGGHIIILNHKDSEYYESTRKQAVLALKEYPGGMQIGGGITAENADEFIGAGASHVIVTSYVFKDGRVDFENLKKLTGAVGRNRIVIDLSCRLKNGKFYVVTDRWQKFTDVELNERTLDRFSDYCDEFLVHGVDVEGRGSGMDEALVKILADKKKKSPDFNPITYAGGITDAADIGRFNAYCDGMLDFTVGSALDLFGGTLSYSEISTKYRN